MKQKVCGEMSARWFYIVRVFVGSVGMRAEINTLEKTVIATDSLEGAVDLQDGHRLEGPVQVQGNQHETDNRGASDATTQQLVLSSDTITQLALSFLAVWQQLIVVSGDERFKAHLGQVR